VAPGRAALERPGDRRTLSSVFIALTPLGARVAGQVRGLVELLEDAVPEVVASQAAYDAGRS
jgi:hypothetical protein